MNAQEIIPIVDSLVFSQTGKHLDDIQEIVIKGVWQGHTYENIAERSNHSESYVRDVGYKLWHILSQQLGEEIHKSNLRSTFERLDLAPLKFIHINTIQSSYNLKFCSYPYQSVDNPKDENNQQQILYCNLQQAPKIINFYGRKNELLILSQWLENQNINLICISGIFGIGKSALVRHFLDINTQSFDIIIWKNLQLFPSLNSLFIDILIEFKINYHNLKNNSLSQLIKLLTQKSCLIILDNLEEIFTPQKFAGELKPEYQEFINFWQNIAEIEGKSKVIVISQEKYLAMENPRGKCLNLLGLTEVEIFKKWGLEAEDKQLLELITVYEGNPFYLENIVSLIDNVFDGNIKEFLAEKEVIIPQLISSNCEKLFKRLSEVEQKIILKLCHLPELAKRKDLRENLDLSLTDFANGLQSLQQRNLVFKIKEQNLFKLSPIFREFIRNTSDLN